MITINFGGKSLIEACLSRPERSYGHFPRRPLIFNYRRPLGTWVAKLPLLIKEHLLFTTQILSTFTYTQAYLGIYKEVRRERSNFAIF